MNEPDNSFGTPGSCGQEGMEVSANQRAEVINGLFSALETAGLSTTVGIISDESSSISLALTEYSTWLPSVANKLAAICHHGYGFESSAAYTAFANTVKSLAPGKATWMSASRSFTQGFDPTITNALMFSGLVFQSLVTTGEPHYDFWTLVSNGLGCSPLTSATCPTTPNSVGWNDGMIYYDPSYATNKNFALYITKHFWTYKHFGNFVKREFCLSFSRNNFCTWSPTLSSSLNLYTAGSVRLPLIGSDVREWMMAVSTATTYSLILMNPNTTDTTLTVSFPSTAVCPTGAFRTSATEDWATVADATASGSAWSVLLKATSLTTYTFNRAAC
ncbi:hypothetical protein MSAN_01817600 [Mycena sanguinolenta]|uniref:Glycoside hydrolase family 30 protein n=1 Tax=Mycena sanguinolenta TaxID=230812 RepID=A0A8H6XV01_9AGAR|nr:hypothetical protein MSAN_01817600 [Mycena sanguinolenta]